MAVIEVYRLWRLEVVVWGKRWTHFAISPSMLIKVSGLKKRMEKNGELIDLIERFQ